jgi:hypothetical protein
MAGLITFASPRDLPEGASPRNWDVDYSVGSVFTRPGLESVYAYATTLSISGYFLSSGGLATFTYSGSEPTTNEGFLLSGFTGPLSVLNGQTVYVESASMTQFTAVVTDGPFGTFINLSGTAVSTTGLFIGPNTGSIATSTTWNSPLNVFSPTAYASASSGTEEVAGPTAPATVTPEGTGVAWSNPSNLITVGGSYATVSLASNSAASLLSSGTAFTLPSGSTITGIVVSLIGKYVGTGTVSVALQMATSGLAIGTPVTFAMNSTASPYSKGSSSYLWGTAFTPATVNGSVLGVLLSASVTGGSGTVSANNLQVTVYYTLSETSEVLTAQGFGFAVALTAGISGFGTSFSAYTSDSSSLSMQLLLNGVPVGTPKSLTLTTTPTIYTLGGSSDPWGYVWSAADANSPQFGVQITATGTGTTYVGDLDMLTYITAALVNFNWVGSYQQNNNSLYTLALDASGNIWQEDVINNPGVLSLSLSGIIPNSFANGATIDNDEFIMFSDLSIGTDRPRQLDANGNWYPVTQVGPGAAPSFAAATGSIGGILALSSYAWSGGIAAFTFAATSSIPTVGSLYVIAGTGTSLDGQVVIVLSSPPPTDTTFSAEVTGTFPAGPTNISGTMTPQFSYAIASITQPPAYMYFPAGMGFWLNNGSGGAGTDVIVYYSTTGAPPDPALVPFNQNIATYVYITGAQFGDYNFNGVWQVTGVGSGNYPGTSEPVNYFTFTYSSSGNVFLGIAGARYRVTGATLTLATPVDTLTAGTQITITGATPAGWNNTWVISQAVNSGQFTITTTQYNGNGVATYGWQYASLTNSNPPVAGDLILITGATNNAGFNGTFAIASVSGSTFTINVNLPLAAQPNPVPEGSAQAVMFGTVFNFDPGELFVGTNTDVIYGNDTGTGDIAVLGSTLVPVGAGTRQAIVFFITASNNWTPASPPVTFTVATDANILNVSQIPIGPPDVVGRGIAITEAGANGVPGANFYVIVEPVTNTIGTTTVTYSSTIINDNISTTAAFSFTDAVLLNSQEVDIPGFDLFGVIEIGSCGWCVPYSSRMFYGLQLNKVQNLNNTTFDGGYQALNQPAGWGLYLTDTTNPELQLVNSPVTGDAYYVINNTGSIQAQMGLISQTAYQDPYNVAIIAANTAYSVRVACACPSGVRLGTLVIDLTDLSGGNFGTTYGSFKVPLSSMGSLPTVFSGPLLSDGIFTGKVSPTLQIRMWVQNMGVGADVLVDRFEVYPTAFPYLKAQVYGSYINKPESVDASPDGGIIDTTTENPQACMGGFVLRDNLYLLKTNSMYYTKDNPNSEPGGWSLTEVSNRVGAVGINAYDVGEEWAVTACRNGIYGFDGGKPQLINLEILQIWDQINWNYGNSICIRNDTANRRIYCAVPLPTGTSPEGVPTATVQWLPYAPYNPAPTTPNVILMLNYQAIGSFEELMADIGTHSTMFGTLANPDMRRKWTIWNIATPYMGAVLQADLIDTPIYFCNGISSSKIYQLNDNQLSDDGVAIYGLYTTYGFVNAVKAATLPIFGMHTKRYTVLQTNLEGAGTATVRLLPNDLSAKYPYAIPGGIKLSSPANDDYMRSINAKGQRMFFEISTNNVGSWFDLCKVLLTGKQDAWSSINPTGGGNNGIV